MGILIIATTFLLYGAAYFFYTKERLAHSLLFILLAGFALRFFCASDPMLHRWDERYHALVAKNIIDEPLHPKLYKKQIYQFDEMNWATSETWLHKQPFPLWTMAVSMNFFGVHELSMRLPSVLFSTLGIWLIFLIGKHLYDEKIGLMAAFFFSINGLIIELTAGRIATDHIDVFFLFLVELSVFFIVLDTVKKSRWYILLAGLTCGLAILTKWLPALIVFPLYLTLNYRKKSWTTIFTDLLLMGIVTLAVAAPWQIYTYKNFPAEYLWEQRFNYLHFTEGLDGNGRPWWFFIDGIRITVNELIYVVLLWFGWRVFKEKLSHKIAFLSLWIIVPFLVFSCAQTKLPGYLLFTFPAYFILMALFVEFLLKQEKKILRNNMKWLVKLTVVALFVLAFRYGMERVKPFENQSLGRAAKQELTELDFPKKSIVFNVPCPIEMMFRTDVLAYRNMPSVAKVNELMEENYQIYIVDDEQLPTDIQQHEAINQIELPATLIYCNQNIR